MKFTYLKMFQVVSKFLLGKLAYVCVLPNFFILYFLSPLNFILNNDLL